MKKNIILLTALLALFSCSKEDSENKGSDIPRVEEVSTTKEDVNQQIDEFISTMTSTGDFTSDDLNAINSLAGLMPDFAPTDPEASKTVVKIVLNYPSVDASGKETIVSGCIAYNKDATSFDEAVLFTHQTAFGDNQVPSSSGMIVLEPGIIARSKNTVVFASDYIGFNASGDHVHPYMNQELAARNEIDMLKAGLQYLKENPQLPQLKTASQGLKTYITGYSQGGAVALATQRALEADAQLCKQMNFRGSYCGAGPHDLEITFELFKTQEKMTLPVVLPYVLVGMYESYPDDFAGIDINRYLSKEAIDNDVIGYIQSMQMTEILTWFQKRDLDSIQKIMSAEALDENSELWKKLTACLRRQNLIDGSWAPQHKVVLYHSSGDDIVSYQNSLKASQLWKDKCTLVTPRLKLGHIAAYATYILTLAEGKYRVE